MDIQPSPIWAPIIGRPREGFAPLHVAVRWPSIVGRPSRSTIRDHLDPRQPSTWLHAPHPPPANRAPMLGYHLPPRSASTPVHLAVHYPRLGATTISTSVHLHDAVRWPSKFRQPNGNPHPRFRPPPSCGWASNFRPRFGSQLGDHMSHSHFAPLHYTPSGGTILRPRIVAPRVCGEKQAPTPKG